MSDQPLADMSAALQYLHRHAGEPSTRDIGKAIQSSHTTVAQALVGSRRCSWKVLEKIVLYLNGDVETFRRLWLAVRQAEDPLPPLPSAQDPPTKLQSEPADVAHAREHHQNLPVTPKDERVEIIWDQLTRTGRFFVPPAIAWEWIKDLRGEGSSNDEG